MNLCKYIEKGTWVESKLQSMQEGGHYPLGEKGGGGQRGPMRLNNISTARAHALCGHGRRVCFGEIIITQVVCFQV